MKIKRGLWNSDDNKWLLLNGCCTASLLGRRPTHKCIPCSTKSPNFAPWCQYPMLIQKEEWALCGGWRHAYEVTWKMIFLRLWCMFSSMAQLSHPKREARSLTELWNNGVRSGEGSYPMCCVLHVWMFQARHQHLMHRYIEYFYVYESK